MRRLAFLLLVVGVPVLGAQQGDDPGRRILAERLRQQILQRWHMQVRRQLNLTDEQAAKLQATEERFFERRREVQQRQRGVVEALRDELQRGVDADPDSVRQLMDARDENRAAIAQIDRAEGAEMMAYLSPVQLARYQLMRQRLQERIAEMRRQRRDRFLGPEDRPQR